MNPVTSFPKGTKLEMVGIDNKTLTFNIILPDDIETDIWTIQEGIRNYAETKAKLEEELRKVSAVIMKLEEELDSKMKLRQG